jgi:hypothetical protein
VAFSAPAHLLHPLPLNNGATTEVEVMPIAPRHFRLTPWAFAEMELIVHFPAREVAEKSYKPSLELESAFLAAPEQMLTVILSE